MRFSLRTLLIAMLLLGPLSSWGWSKYSDWRTQQPDITNITPFRGGLSVVQARCGSRNLITTDGDDLERIAAEFQAELDKPTRHARDEEFRQVDEQFNLDSLPE